MQIKSFIVDSPIGQLSVFYTENKVLEIRFALDKVKHDSWETEPANGKPDKFATKVKTQLLDYFDNPEQPFSVDIQVKGTDFQNAVWQVIASIKAGETLTYSDVARKLGSSPRAVGNACRANPTPIIVPCHRVVAKSGLGGFAGKTTGFNIDMKSWLLEHEQVVLI